MIYLDHAATTMVRPQTREAMAPFLDADFGNPSGIHSVSRRAKNALEEAREEAAELVGADHPLEIVFTASGTEADNLAVIGSALAADRPAGVVTTAVEHEAVLEPARFLEQLGFPVTIVGVDGRGLVDPSEIAAAVTPDTAVVSVMAANNETGVVQPVRKIVEAVRGLSPDATIHTDAVQAFIAQEVTVAATGADCIAIAAHKFGGPKGVGLLYIRNGVEVAPVVRGGGQELGRRSGTHNVAGIVGMVAAMKATVADRDDYRTRVGGARDVFETELARHVAGVTVTAADVARLPQHCHVRFRGVPAETLLIRLDQAGIAAAAGSACQSGALETSHVLAAMGMDSVAAGECVRFSFGWVNQFEDGADAARIVAGVVEEIR